MADIFTKKERSRIMSKIKSKNTGIELNILNELKRRRFKGFVRHSNLQGKPDFVFTNHKIAVFCDGDFWHGYRFGAWDTKLNKFWQIKINSNIKRDRRNTSALRRAGWKVLRLWGHDIKRDPEKCVDRIVALMG